MAYHDINEMYSSTSLRSRIVGAIAQEVPGIDPQQAAGTYLWPIIARSDWIQEWHDADRGADFNPDIGARPGVITDVMILAAVQAVKNAATP